MGLGGVADLDLYVKGNGVSGCAIQVLSRRSPETLSGTSSGSLLYVQCTSNERGRD